MDLRRKTASPRLARWLLRQLIQPRQAAEYALGDLEEDFQRMVDSHRGLRAARRWYWVQVLRCAFPSDTRAADAGYRQRRKEAGIMETLWQDVRFGVRMLAKSPGFTLVAVLTLALGIGANAAIFSVVYNVVLKALPFRDADRIVTLWEDNRKDGLERDDVSPANFLEWAERQQVFEAMATSNPWSLDYTGAGEPETFQNALVSKGFLEILGVRPLLGRAFSEDEFEPGKSNVVMLSYGLWQRRFGSDPGVVGQTFSLDGQPTAVVGILPPEFRLYLHHPDKDALQPQVVQENWKFQRRATYLKVIARLKPGVTVGQAQAAMDAIATQLATEHPNSNAGIGVNVVPLREHLVGKVRPALLVLLGAVGLILLIACANVANLMLARGSGRARELAIRSAMGAGRNRIVRQLVTESALLAAAGCIAGLLLAQWALPVLVSMSPGEVPRLENTQVGTLVLTFAGGLALLTTLVFGIVPALAVSSSDLLDSLKEGTQSTPGPGRRYLRHVLVVGEIALALVLLVGAGLFLRSFVNLINVDPGFDRGQVAALQTFIWDRYTTVPQRLQFTADAMQKMRAVPGVTAAAVTTAVPFLASSQDSSVPAMAEGRDVEAGQEPTVFFTFASPEYFRTLGIPILRGRAFNDFDNQPGSTNPAVILNETAVRRLEMTGDPVGQRIRATFRGRDGAQPLSLEVVGVVGALRHGQLDEEPRAEMFLPYGRSGSGSVIFVVRTASDATPLLPSLKNVIWSLNPTQPFYAATVLEELIDATLRERRFHMTLLGLFAALALCLAAVGIYGVISFTTAQRNREIGIRMALGAQRTQISGLVLRQGLVLAAVGVGLGVTVALIATRFLRAMLFGVQPADPLTYGAISLVLLVVALLACLIPARRATRVDPLVTLRCE